MVYITKIFGRAGTGKTSRLFDEIEHLVETGVAPHQIMFTSFSNKAVDEIVQRLRGGLDIDEEKLKILKRNFRTTHSHCFGLLDLKMGENNIEPEHVTEFLDIEYKGIFDVSAKYDPDEYRLTKTDKKRLSGNATQCALHETVNTMRDCMLDIKDPECLVELYNRTGNTLQYQNYHLISERYDPKYSKKVLIWSRGEYVTLDPGLVIEYATKWEKYLEFADLYDFTRLLTEVYKRGLIITPSAKYLFFDEFQDFSPLQYRIYELWRDGVPRKKVWIAGDDAQVVYRFRGASPSYMLSTPCDDKIKLEKTYRHGKAIYEDSKKYIDAMKIVEPIDLLPADIDGEVIVSMGEEWLEEVKKLNKDDRVYILATTRAWAKALKDKAKEISGFYFVELGSNNQKVRRVVRMYNTIASLDRGESVEWDLIREVIAGTYSLPTNMIIETGQITFTGEQPRLKKRQVLKKIKSKIRNDNFSNLDIYSKRTFTENFLKDDIGWRGRLFMNHIPDLEEVIDNTGEIFPEPAEFDIKKQWGTIHSAKGGEADVVFIGMAVEFPSWKRITEVETRDDVLRKFYVATSRAKYKSVKIYDYIVGGRGEPAPSPDLLFEDGQLPRPEGRSL